MQKLFIFAWFILLQAGLLQAQDEKYTEWYLQKNDVEIFVKEILSGKDTVIVVHGGFGASHHYMMDAVKGLEDKFHFILYDQRGSLLSPVKKENLSFQENVRDLYDLIQALKMKKVKLLCHSMGTLVGMELARQYPDLVDNLVLTGIVIPKSDSVKSVFSERYEKQVKFLLNRKEVLQLKQPYKDKGVDTLRSVDDIVNSPLSHKDLTEYWRINFAAVNIYNVKKYNLLKGGKAYYNPAASVMSETVNWKYDYREIMDENTKTTVINGAYDFFDFNSEKLRELLKDYRKIKLHIIPLAGHNSWIDAPVIFRKYLEKGLLR
ncbi:alpha/beta hydrolase [Sinomicrobium sp. M5D2P17]